MPFRHIDDDEREAIVAALRESPGSWVAVARRLGYADGTVRRIGRAAGLQSDGAARVERAKAAPLTVNRRVDGLAALLVVEDPRCPIRDPWPGRSPLFLDDDEPLGRKVPRRRGE